MRVWIILVACGVVTYAARASFIALGDRVALPETVERALRYVAPAAFAAIAVPSLLGNDGLSNFGDDVPRIIAALVAGLVIHRWRNVPASLAFGMVTLWLLQWVGV